MFDMDELFVRNDGDYEWHYEIYVKETRYLVGTNYEKYKDAKEI